MHKYLFCYPGELDDVCEELTMDEYKTLYPGSCTVRVMPLGIELVKGETPTICDACSKDLGDMVWVLGERHVHCEACANQYLKPYLKEIPEHAEATSPFSEN